MNSIIISALILLNAIPAFAGRESGGGDLACDAKIKSIAANINSWIIGGGAQVGGLDLSSSKNPDTQQPYSFTEYGQTMTTLLNLPLDSSCVSIGDTDYPVQVGNDSKVCVSSVQTGVVHTTCDQLKFLGMSPDEQIEQIHHEYAINVPGLEPDFGSISTYKISTQLSAYTQNVAERRLVVGPAFHVSANVRYQNIIKNPDGSTTIVGPTFSQPDGSTLHFWAEQMGGDKNNFNGICKLYGFSTVESAFDPSGVQNALSWWPEDIDYTTENNLVKVDANGVFSGFAVTNQFTTYLNQITCLSASMGGPVLQSPINASLNDDGVTVTVINPMLSWGDQTYGIVVTDIGNLDYVCSMVGLAMGRPLSAAIPNSAILNGPSTQNGMCLSGVMKLGVLEASFEPADNCTYIREYGNDAANPGADGGKVIGMLTSLVCK